MSSGERWNARFDISREDVETLTQGLRKRAVHPVDGALHATSTALHDTEATL